MKNRKGCFGEKENRNLYCGFCDLDRIQTCNLLSRNQMRYSVAPRGLIFGLQR